MKVFNLGQTNSVLGSYVAQLRDKNVQKDRMRFRSNLQRTGRVFAYEISKTLNYSVKHVDTPLGIADVATPTANDTRIFSLAGQRLASPRRGLNIVGGKKVVTK